MFEAKLKRLYESFKPINELQREIKKLGVERRRIEAEIKSLAQQKAIIEQKESKKIPELLNAIEEYNKRL